MHRIRVEINPVKHPKIYGIIVRKYSITTGGVLYEIKDLYPINVLPAPPHMRWR